MRSLVICGPRLSPRRHSWAKRRHRAVREISSRHEVGTRPPPRLEKRDREPAQSSRCAHRGPRCTACSVFTPSHNEFPIIHDRSICFSKPRRSARGRGYNETRRLPCAADSTRTALPGSSRCGSLYTPTGSQRASRRQTGGRRWYPDASESLDTSNYRYPSRRYPWSYMLACRTLAHCARLERCTDLLLARRIATVIDKAVSVEAAVVSCRAIISAARKAQRHTSHQKKP